MPSLTQEQKFEQLVRIFLTDISKNIAKKRGISETEALELFYKSKLYDLFMDEETKIWHFSGLTIANLLEQELNGEKIEFPEEV